MPTLTKGRTQADVFRHVHHQSYCLASGKLVNPDATARAAQNLCGQPVKASGANYVLVKAGDEANAIGLVFSETGLVALGVSEVTTKKYAILLRGPAVIDRDSLPALDVAGGSLTVATIVTALAARNPAIIPVDQPDTTSEQTT
jgi:hypothetical protein